MKIHVACGGTGGHIFPGLATARELRKRGHEITLWMAGNDLESQALEGWRDQTITVPARGFQGGGLLGAGRTFWSLFRASRQCARLMRPNQPDALLAMGSYASIGPVRAALDLKVPVVLHEANVLPGKAISLFAGKAAAVAAAFEETHYYLRRRRIEITGMPLRDTLVAAASERRAPAATPFTVLALGGSRGARTLNQVFALAAAKASRLRPDLQWIHVTGTAHEAETRKQYERLGVRAEVLGFCSGIEFLYGRAHLAMCRAGASTCAELALFGLPALLIPYPHAAKNHQEANARALEKTGAADVLLEDDLEDGWLAQYLVGMRDAPERLDRMRQAAARRARSNAAGALADCVERAAAGNPAS